MVGGVLLLLVGALVSLPDRLPLVLGGLLLITVGFFAAHAGASSWLSRHVGSAPAQASALYLFSYYAGSSLGGTIGGFAFEWARWPGLVAFVAVLGVLALVAVALLGRVEAGSRRTGGPTDPEPEEAT